ncbi:MAG: peptidylprolyl isomerase [Gammaproteobacteria bacterium]|nr:peptidylprolyl isomerase [Gammaproteobacteria bacterium]
MNKFTSPLFILLILIAPTSYADVIVRMNFQYGVQNNNVDIRLFDQIAPVTVANFLKYANGTTNNGGSYNNTLLHRTVAGFVLQGGGFSFDTTINNYPAGISAIVEDAPIVNEFSLSNKMGTIAMAKLNGDPNSATSQWFFNLFNNSLNLDKQNGGFTVFGAVIGDGMTIVNDMATIPIFDKSADNLAFVSLPLINYTVPNTVLPDNLVLLKTVTQLLTISEDLDFGTIETGSTKSSVVTLENTSTNAITIASLATINPIANPFSITQDSCSNTILNIGAKCTITISYAPQIDEIINDSFNIEFTSPVINFDYTVKGTSISTDTDGIASSIENMAPNNGDGNIDGTADAVQNNVSSFIDANNNYITLESNIGSEITSINAIPLSNLSPAPDNYNFPSGAIDFNIMKPATDSVLEVGILLPAGVIPQRYFIYGPTPANSVPHWYDFTYDALTGTGAFIGGNVTFTSPVGGSVITRSVIKLVFRDGGRGDSDLTVNGFINTSGGYAINNKTSTDTGNISIYTLAILIILPGLIRIRNK